ncbi:MAG: FAD-binding oxidoreductase [Marinomonas sp.]
MTNKQTLTDLKNALPELDWVTSPIHVKRLSKDFFWFSPLLQEQLTGKHADIAVRPKSEDELKALIATCVELNINVTLRGGGTGNYGQSVPLEGGVQIDLSQYNQINWLKDGIVSVQPGMKIGDLEEQVRLEGFEMRCMPSTYKMATVGGLFAGGFGGIGSINYGPISAPGTVQSIRVMTIEESPKIIELTGQETLTFHHSYGTNGIIIGLEIALAPAKAWNEYMLAFGNIEDAFHFANALAKSVGIEKREISLYDPNSARHFPEAAASLEATEFLVISLINANGTQALEHLLAKHQGRIAWSQTFAEMQEKQHTLIEYCWNHSTLHAMKEDKSLTHLQANYDGENTLSQLASIKESVGDEVQVHLEFIRLANDSVAIVGIPLVRYSTPERLTEIMALHNEFGIKIDNSHVYTLEDGKHGGSLNETILESKKANDPHMLLNPGKIRSIETAESIA